LFFAACTDAELKFELMLDTGSTLPADANLRNEDSGTTEPDSGPLDSGNPMAIDTGVENDGGLTDAGTATVTMDAGTATVATDAGTSTVGMDAGFSPDARLADTGVAVDTGLTPDSGPADTGLQTDAEPIDSGIWPDAATPDTGIWPDAAQPDAGFAPDAMAADSGVVVTRMSFFITSRTVEINGIPAIGGDFSGIIGADSYCLTLAQEADPTDTRPWRAYLSSSSEDAIDRIGTGPWHNANQQLIANSTTDLVANPPTSNLILDERGRAWNGAASFRHDVLTGSKTNGRRFANLAEMTTGNANPSGSLFNFPDGSFSYTPPTFDFSCNDWTSNGISNYGVVGHADHDQLTMGTGSDEWTTSHVTACTQSEMNLNGGDIRLYCFAAN